MLEREAVAREEERLRVAVRDLDDQQRSAYFQAAKQQVKDPDTYAALNYSLFFGLHHLYLGNHQRFLLVMVLLVIAGFAFFNGEVILSVVVVMLSGVVELYELFRAQVIVQDHNNRVAQQLLDELARQRDGSPR